MEEVLLHGAKNRVCGWKAMNETHRNRPKTCEFTKEVKVEALRKADWCCEECGIKKKDTVDGYLEIHHRVGIAVALHNHPELSHAMIASIANAVVLCIPCHDLMDREDPKHHKEYAVELRSMFVRQLQLEFATLG